MNNISITVPLDNYLALTRASDLFHGLAQDLKKDGATLETVPGAVEKSPTPVIESAPVIPAAEVPNVVPAAPIVPVSQVVAPVTEPSSASMPRTDKPDPLSLDKDGIPWDARIHASSQLRLVKNDTWKLIKSIKTKSPGLVEQVKAELLAAQTVVSGTPEPLAVNLGEANPVAPVATTPAAEAFAQPLRRVVVPVIPAVIDFAGLTEKITGRVAIDENYMTTVEAVLAEFGVVGGFSMILGNDALIQQVDARLDALCQPQG